MKIAKIAVLAAFIFSSAFCPESSLAGQPLTASDLTTVTANDIASLTGDLRLPDPVLAEILPRGGLPPVVITVAGLKFGEVGVGPFNIYTLQKLFNLIFAGHTPSDRRTLEKAFNDFPRLYSEVSSREASGDIRELPDNYLEARLQELPEYTAAPFTIIPFLWSRDPADSHIMVPAFAAQLATVYDTYKTTGRPIYILTHSWGSVLMHDAMHKLAKTRPDVKIDKFITTGSPLSPGNAFTAQFMAIERRKEGLMTEVSKPAMARSWINIWAVRDAISNAIPAADKNTQVDVSLEKVEPELIKIILAYPLLRDQACKDLIKVRNMNAWHKAYIYDFTAVLDSLKEDINLPVFHKVVAPQVIKTQPLTGGIR